MQKREFCISFFYNDDIDKRDSIEPNKKGVQCDDTKNNSIIHHQTYNILESCYQSK